MCICIDLIGYFCVSMCPELCNRANAVPGVPGKPLSLSFVRLLLPAHFYHTLQLDFYWIRIHICILLLYYLDVLGTYLSV